MPGLVHASSITWSLRFITTSVIVTFESMNRVLLEGESGYVKKDNSALSQRNSVVCLQSSWERRMWENDVLGVGMRVGLLRVDY